MRRETTTRVTIWNEKCIDLECRLEKRRKAVG